MDGTVSNHDPVLGDMNNPITQHRYLYANGDGVNFADPLGLFVAAGGKGEVMTVSFTQSQYSAMSEGRKAQAAAPVAQATRMAEATTRSYFISVPPTAGDMGSAVAPLTVWETVAVVVPPYVWAAATTAVGLPAAAFLTALANGDDETVKQVVYHYTDESSARLIMSTGKMKSTATYRGGNNTFPAGIYASTIAPNSLTFLSHGNEYVNATQENLGMLFKGNPDMDTSWYVEINNDNGLFIQPPTDKLYSQIFRYYPHPGGGMLTDMTVESIGPNPMPVR